MGRRKLRTRFRSGGRIIEVLGEADRATRPELSKLGGAVGKSRCLIELEGACGAWRWLARTDGLRLGAVVRWAVRTRRLSNHCGRSMARYSVPIGGRPGHVPSKVLFLARRPSNLDCPDIRGVIRAPIAGKNAPVGSRADCLGLAVNTLDPIYSNEIVNGTTASSDSAVLQSRAICARRLGAS